MAIKHNFISLQQVEISNAEFKLLKDYIYKNIGISLSDQKVSLLRSRLNKRLYILGFKTFMEYYDYLRENKDEYTKFINAISTNVTYFFREESHWKFLAKKIKHITTKKQKLRIWSSACSSGEEPYSVAIFLHEYLKDIENFNIKILATDISHAAIQKAQQGVYLTEQITDVHKHHNLQKYFTKNSKEHSQIDQKIATMILFRTFNLVYGDYSIFKSKKFDIIFCRNVLIYFDDTTREKVVSNLVDQLCVGGYLLIGHSESLMENKHLKYVAPSIYQKK